MKEVKEVKNLDKNIKVVSNKINKGTIIGYTIGMAMASIIVMLIANLGGISLAQNAVLYNTLSVCAIGGASVLTTLSIREKISKSKLKKTLDKVKEETGVELTVEDVERALERVEVKSYDSYAEDKTTDLAEREVSRKFFTLDGKGQLQVLQFVRKTIKDEVGKTDTQTLYVLEEEDKKDISYSTDVRVLSLNPAKKSDGN